MADRLDAIGDHDPLDPVSRSTRSPIEWIPIGVTFDPIRDREKPIWDRHHPIGDRLEPICRRV
jgi:hypothetical protein